MWSYSCLPKSEQVTAFVFSKKQVLPKAMLSLNVMYNSTVNW